MRKVRKLLGKLQTCVSTLMTWVTFIFIPVSFLFAVYHLFCVFSLARVIAGLSVTVVCVYVNKAL